MAEIQLLPLTPDDIELIYPIESQCHLFPSSKQNLLTCFSKRYCNTKLLVDGQLVGFYIADLVVDEMTLQNICIRPDRQGQGYGKQLMAHFIETARQHHAVQLWLEVRESNLSAIAIYHQVGFDVTGKRKDYYPAKQGREDALLMAMMLFYD